MTANVEYLRKQGIHCLSARYKCSIKNVLLKLRTKAEYLKLSLNYCFTSLVKRRNDGGDRSEDCEEDQGRREGVKNNSLYQPNYCSAKP